MATILISVADASRDFAGVMAKVRAGAEIVIEDGTNPPAVIAENLYHWKAWPGIGQRFFSPLASHTFILLPCDKADSTV